MRKDHKRWFTCLVIAMLFSHTVAKPISDTNRGDKIHIFPKLTSLWSFKNPETEYTCPNVDSNFNLTIKARQYKCRDWEDIICMDSVSVGRVFFCIPKSTSCSIGIGWTVEAVDGQDVSVKESFCQVDYYQSEPSRCYDACKTKHERLDLIPPKYLLHSKGDNKGPAILTCNAADGFYNRDNITCVAFDSNLPADFCTNVNIVNPCAKGYMPLNNGTCLDIRSQAYQELVTSSKCKALSGKDRDSENKDVPATLKPVDQGGVSTRKRNNDDMEDTSGEINDADDTNEEVNDVAEKNP
ncbi:uncharacterized protein LOC132752445 [Ruditapes philippinarum]|uniref:uncharacterized protein LOC132752445 n=1 Tax=Ruditapes philippinarum TaxID=129788 RepID=UPI00295A70F6|nr:uncharacterized protein LOC132752445 [Ruditapes philippinarum]